MKLCEICNENEAIKDRIYCEVCNKRGLGKSKVALTMIKEIQDLINSKEEIIINVRGQERQGMSKQGLVLSNRISTQGEKE